MFFNKDDAGLSFDRPLESAPMPAIQLFEDVSSVALHPFHLIDGVEGIRMGAMTQKARWEIVSEELARGHVDRTWRVNARWIPPNNAMELLTGLAEGQSLTTDNTVLATCGVAGPGLEPIALTADSQHLLCHSNDLFSLLGEAIHRDVEWMRTHWDVRAYTGSATVYGPSEDILIAPGAVIRAASIDSESGPVVIGPDATIEAGAHLKGPLIVCEGATVRMGACISGATVIGPHCKVGGEISNVNFQGWGNKAHGGFLGNSVIGRWCNLGAGTNASNLKNTYGEVRQWDADSGSMTGSGMQFCGLLMGDHSKCGIGTTFNTGTVIDPACVIFDAGFPPKHLPAFSWYNARTESMEIQDLDRMLATAETVMARRNLTLTDDQRVRLSQLHAQRLHQA